MKSIATLGIVMSLMTISCKKSIDSPAAHEKSPYTVLLVGHANDTTYSSTMLARVETVGLASAEDSKLKAVLTGYDGHGGYILDVTNKQNCTVLIDWGWDGLSISDIQPGGYSGSTLTANQTKTYHLTGTAKVGKIKLKAEGWCGNSSTLILNITLSILPIKMIDNAASYDKVLNKVTVTFTIEDPTECDWIIIRKDYKDEMIIGCDHTTKQYNIKL